MRSAISEKFSPDGIAADFLSISRKAMLQHVDVAVRLMGHLHDADPDLAEMWRSQLQRERTETGRPGLVVYLRGEFLEVLRKHPRYGYLAEWMAEWTEEAETYRAAALADLGGDQAALEKLDEEVRLRH
ncbi:hypothetical protein AB9E14_07600 [Rhizobium leguminosarum]|uniref:hypothetical protein n=1 Tax=Rhizobium leguminosarum TaxID=384 RepID=UPI003F9C2821|nr:hypothetical protein [Rhizobium leguminosarum]